MQETDSLRLDAILVMAYCGVLKEEQHRRQPFEISVEMFFDTSLAGKSDQLSDTVDYCMAIDEINGFFEHNKIHTIEHMAQLVADISLRDKRITKANISVKKLQPPVPHQIGSAGVSITRYRD